VRRLIINADDFGLTPGVNRAILEAHGSGVVSSATMMANGPAVEDAIRLARRAEGLSLGCHVVLIDGRPVLPPNQIQTLTVRNGAPRFRERWLDFFAAVIRGQISSDEILAEASAQITKLQGAGLRLSHFDTHKHTHILPVIARPLLRAAKACGIHAVRNPFAPLKPLAFSHLVRRPRLWSRYTEVRVLRRFSERFCEMVETESMVTTDGTFGIVITGSLDERLFAAIAGCIPEGTWELVCHPGYCDDDLRRAGTRLRESRPAELRVLTSPAARQALEHCGIEVISYWDLPAATVSVTTSSVSSGLPG
jgi:hopanoid biosynthesis associated protein HpnK